MLNYSERDSILNKVLDYSKTQASKGFHYSYAFGLISVMLTDDQLKDLERLTSRT